MREDEVGTKGSAMGMVGRGGMGLRLGLILPCDVWFIGVGQAMGVGGPGALVSRCHIG